MQRGKTWNPSKKFYNPVVFHFAVTAVTRTGNNPDGGNPGQITQVGRECGMSLTNGAGVGKECTAEFVTPFGDHPPRDVQPIDVNMWMERSAIAEAKVNCATDFSVTLVDLDVFDNQCGSFA